MHLLQRIVAHRRSIASHGFLAQLHETQTLITRIILLLSKGYKEVYLIGKQYDGSSIPITMSLQTLMPERICIHRGVGRGERTRRAVQFVADRRSRIKIK